MNTVLIGNRAISGVETIDGVTVIPICSLLDMMFCREWVGLEPGIIHGAVVRWLNKHPAEATYHSWEGPSFLQLAERNRAVEKAKSEGKALVVVEALS